MKGKQRNKCRKNTIGLRNLKLKLYFKNGRRKKKENKNKKTGKLQRTVKAQHTGRGL